MKQSSTKVSVRFALCVAVLSLGGTACSHVREAMQSLQTSMAAPAEQPTSTLSPAPIATTTSAGRVPTRSDDASNYRNVVVNGKRLAGQELVDVDMLDCGVAVPDGNYWLDPSTRTWGYVGSPDAHAFPECNASPGVQQDVVQQDVEQPRTAGDDSESDADELERIRRSTELSRYQTEIDRMENNDGMYVPSR